MSDPITWTVREQPAPVERRYVLKAVGAKTRDATPEDLAAAGYEPKQRALELGLKCVALDDSLRRAEQERDEARLAYFGAIRERDGMHRERDAALARAQHLAAEVTEAKRDASRRTYERDCAQRGLAQCLEALRVPHADAAEKRAAELLATESELSRLRELECAARELIGKLTRDENGELVSDEFCIALLDPLDDALEALDQPAPAQPSELERLRERLEALGNYENFERCYLGGYSDAALLEAFRHGMSTVCSAARQSLPASGGSADAATRKDAGSAPSGPEDINSAQPSEARGSDAIELHLAGAAHSLAELHECAVTLLNETGCHDMAEAAERLAYKASRPLRTNVQPAEPQPQPSGSSPLPWKQRRGRLCIVEDANCAYVCECTFPKDAAFIVSAANQVGGW